MRQLEVGTNPLSEANPIVRIRQNGMDVWCDGVRASNRKLVFLSIFGIQAGVRSVWAHLVEQGYSSIEVAGEWISTDRDYKYATLKSLISKQCLHMVMMHPNATSIVNPFGQFFYALGEHPELQFWARFNRMCVIPVRQEWRDKVWELGIENKLIMRLTGLGPIDGYSVDTGEDWAKIIKQAVQKGDLK